GECGISERSGHSFDCSEYNPATRTSLQQALDLFVKSFFESLGNTNSSAQYNYSHRRRIAVVCVQTRTCRELAIRLCRRTHPARSNNLQNGPDRQGATCNRDRPAGE